MRKFLLAAMILAMATPAMAQTVVTTRRTVVQQGYGYAPQYHQRRGVVVQQPQYGYDYEQPQYGYPQQYYAPQPQYYQQPGFSLNLGW